MTVKDLRTLADNLEEYIHVPGGIERLKKTILHLAVSGKLVPQDPSEGTGEDLYKQIQAEKQKLIAEGKLKKQKPLPEVTRDEIPFEIPEIWKWSRLGNVIELKYGKGIDKNHRDMAFEFPFYGANGELDKVDKYLVAQNGIIVGRKGSAGAVNLVDGPFWPSDVTYYIEEGQFGAFDRRYLYYLLISLDLNSLANGIKPGLNRNEAYELPIILYPIKTQKRIAEKIDSIFLLIEGLAKKYYVEQKEREKLVGSSLANLAKGEGEVAFTHLTEIIRTKSDVAQLRKTILHLAVSGQLVPQDPTEGTGEELFAKIQAEKAKLINEGKIKKQKPLPEISDDEIPFQIPKTWKWARLGSLGKTQTGSTPSKNRAELFGDYMPFIKPGDISESGVNYQNESLSVQGANELDRVAERGSLLMVCIGTIGKCQLIDRSCSFNQQINGITPYIDISNFLLFAAQSKYFNDIAWEKSSSTTISILNKGRWEKILMPLPPTAEQARIVQKTIQLLELVTKLEKHLEK